MEHFKGKGDVHIILVFHSQWLVVLVALFPYIYDSCLCMSQLDPGWPNKC